MLHTDIEIYLDKGRFIRWTIMAGHFSRYILKDAKKNLIAGGEHIVSLEELLDHCDKIPGYLIDEGVLDQDWIDSDCITLIYNPRERDEQLLNEHRYG